MVKLIRSTTIRREESEISVKEREINVEIDPSRLRPPILYIDQNTCDLDTWITS